ncbi:MAG TPA: NAD(P)-binding domain-containing protein [Bryobacteraceae bacterium]|nr:NAD(P)-binding domain-containing protein [Bryobacteraceae bacterium]
METLLSVLIASAVTLFFMRGYLKTLSNKRSGGQPADSSHVPLQTTPCPRCGKPVLLGASFCGSCGAALAMWNVHRAAIQTSSLETVEKGKPRPVINASLCIGCGSCVDVCPESGTLALASGKAILQHPERCTGQAQCITACPTSAISLAFGNVLQTIRVPNVNENFETNLPGLYIVGELGGMGLIKSAINEGKLVIDRLRQRFEQTGQWSPARDDHGQILPCPEEHGGPYDVLIAGAGPAGLSASLAAHQYGLHYVTVEQGEVAATIRNYPRHKFLMAEPIEMPLYGSLYIGDGTKESLLSVWETILVNTGVRVRTGEGVRGIRRQQDLFAVETAKGTYTARNVVLALGKRGTPRKLGVAGEDLSKVAYRLIEAETYSDQDILIVGGGDSAVEAALAVAKGGRNRVTLSYRGDDFKRLRDRNHAQLAQAEADGRIRVLRKSQIHEIRPASVLLECEGQVSELANDFVFVLIGGESPDEFLRKTGIEIVEKAISG